MGKQLSKACYYAAHITNITRMVHVGDVHQSNALLFLSGSIDPYHPVPILLRHVPAEPRGRNFAASSGVRLWLRPGISWEVQSPGPTHLAV